MKTYNCVVCIKQVPDTGKVTGDAMKADGTINRAALPAIFNPEDRNALEAALWVKETYGGTVTVITMGLPAATTILREALMCGADKAVLVTDRKAAGSDTLATSYILSQAVKKFNPDLVFCGRQAIDGDTAQVGPQIGEKLDCAVVTYLEKLEMAKLNVLKTYPYMNEFIAFALKDEVKDLDNSGKEALVTYTELMERYKSKAGTPKLKPGIDQDILENMIKVKENELKRLQKFLG